MTDLCVAIFANDPAQVRRDVAAAAEEGANLVELRLDRLTDQPMDINIVHILPCILTCRPTWEGGESRFSDEERLAILDHFAPGKPRYIDLELETYRRSPKVYSWPVGTILSIHDFKGRPDRLYYIV